MHTHAGPITQDPFLARHVQNHISQSPPAVATILFKAAKTIIPCRSRARWHNRRISGGSRTPVRAAASHEPSPVHLDLELQWLDKRGRVGTCNTLRLPPPDTVAPQLPALLSIFPNHLVKSDVAGCEEVSDLYSKTTHETRRDVPLQVVLLYESLTSAHQILRGGRLLLQHLSP
jgi:hypothetical protein